MAKKVYIGVDDVARKVKKMYLGVHGKARKIKKGYIGIGGVARPFWTGGELAYYGTITALSKARCDLAATSVGNYALFGGGYYDRYLSIENTFIKSAFAYEFQVIDKIETEIFDKPVDEIFTENRIILRRV